MNAVVKAELKTGGSLAAIVPQDAEQAFRMAQLVCKAGMAPRGMEQPEKVVTAILHGMEIGLKPMQAVQSIAIVNGRPAVWGDAAIGMVRASGLCAWVTERIDGEGDAAVAVCETQRVGEPQPQRRTFSVADAKRAGLWGKSGPWQQYPLRMLQLRARAFALRDVYADVLKGLHVAEEAQDYRPFNADRSMPEDRPVNGAALLAQAQDDDPPAPVAQIEAPKADVQPVLVGWTFTDAAGKAKAIKTEGDFVDAMAMAIKAEGFAPPAMKALWKANADMLTRLDGTNAEAHAVLYQAAVNNGLEE